MLVALLVGSVTTIRQYSVTSCLSPVNPSIKGHPSPSYVSFGNVLRQADLHNQNYTWWGNQWMVPSFSGIPMFSQQDMLDAFSQVDTLWIGDSTTRRAYATLYSILNHSWADCPPHDVSNCRNSSSRRSSVDGTESISIDELNAPKVIDVNKRGYLGIIDETSCVDRRAEANATYFKPGMHELWDNHSLCRTLPNVEYQRERTRRTGAGALFDFAKANCFQELEWISKLEHELKRYSLIIIGLGLHDAIRRCSVPMPKVKVPLEEMKVVPRSSKGQTSYMSLQDVFRKYGWKGAEDISTVMQRVHDESGSDQKTTVFWRTTGFSEDAKVNQTRSILDMNQDAKTLVAHQPTNRTGSMGIIDWGTAIFPRSFPPHRITGDISPHYGLEVRLLMAQMTTQQVFRFLLAPDGTVDQTVPR